MTTMIMDLPEKERCPECRGIGLVKEKSTLEFPTLIKCPICNGTGLNPRGNQ